MTEKERIEYGNMRYEQGYKAGYTAGFDEGVGAEVADEAWESAYNEGYEAGEEEGYNNGIYSDVVKDQIEEARQEGFTEGAAAEQKRIQTVIRMHMEWAKRDGKGRDFIFWNNVAETLTPVNYVPMTDEEWRQELENLGF